MSESFPVAGAPVVRLCINRVDEETICGRLPGLDDHPAALSGAKTCVRCDPFSPKPSLSQGQSLAQLMYRTLRPDSRRFSPGTSFVAGSAAALAACSITYAHSDGLKGNGDAKGCSIHSAATSGAVTNDTTLAAAGHPTTGRSSLGGQIGRLRSGGSDRETAGRRGSAGRRVA